MADQAGHMRAGAPGRIGGTRWLATLHAACHQDPTDISHMCCAPAFLEFEELSRAVGDNVRRAQRQLQRSVGRLPFADALAAAEGSGPVRIHLPPKRPCEP
jgi:hypothetical protein